MHKQIKLFNVKMLIIDFIDFNHIFFNKVLH